MTEQVNKDKIYKLRGILEDWQSNIGKVNENIGIPCGDNPKNYDWIMENFVDDYNIVKNGLDKVKMRNEKFSNFLDCDWIEDNIYDFFSFQEEVGNWLDDLDLKKYKGSDWITGEEWSLNVVADLRIHLESQFVFALLDWIKEEAEKCKQKIIENEKENN